LLVWERTKKHEFNRYDYAYYIRHYR
jgi:hypothetical protein